MWQATEDATPQEQYQGYPAAVWTRVGPEAPKDLPQLHHGSSGYEPLPFLHFRQQKADCPPESCYACSDHHEFLSYKKEGPATNGTFLSPYTARP